MNGHGNEHTITGLQLDAYLCYQMDQVVQEILSLLLHLLILYLQLIPVDQAVLMDLASQNLPLILQGLEFLEDLWVPAGLEVLGHLLHQCHLLNQHHQQHH